MGGGGGEGVVRVGYSLSPSIRGLSRSTLFCYISSCLSLSLILLHRRSQQPTLIFSSPMSTVSVVAPNGGRPCVRHRPPDGTNPPPTPSHPPLYFFTFPPTLSVCFPLSLSSRVLYIPNEDVRWWALPPSWPFWSFAAHSLNSPTTNNGRKLLMPSHFFFPHSSHPSVYRYPHKNCRSCFSYLPFFFSLYFNTVTTKFFFSSKTNKTTKKKGRFENRKSANNLTACEERKNNISEVLTSAKSFTVGESKKQTTDGFPAGSWLFVDFHTLDDNIFLFLFLFFFLDMNKKRGRKKKEGLAGG